MYDRGGYEPSVEVQRQRIDTTYFTTLSRACWIEGELLFDALSVHIQQDRTNTSVVLSRSVRRHRGWQSVVLSEGDGWRTRHAFLAYLLPSLFLLLNGADEQKNTRWFPWSGLQLVSYCQSRSRRECLTWFKKRERGGACCGVCVGGCYVCGVLFRMAFYSGRRSS